MCNDELEIWINRLKEEADGILKRHNREDGGYICEICLKQIETLVSQLRYECNMEKESRSE